MTDFGPYPAPPPGFLEIADAPRDGRLLLVVARSREGELYDSSNMTPYVAWWSPGGAFSKPSWARETESWNQRGSEVAHPTHYYPGLDLGRRP